MCLGLWVRRRLSRILTLFRECCAGLGWLGPIGDLAIHVEGNKLPTSVSFSRLHFASLWFLFRAGSIVLLVLLCAMQSCSSDSARCCSN